MPVTIPGRALEIDDLGGKGGGALSSDPRVPRRGFAVMRSPRRNGVRAVVLAALLAAAAALAALALGRGPSATVRPGPARGAAVRPVRHARPGAARIAGAAARHARVPILMYHVIAPAPPRTPFPELWVPPRRFAAQIAALARAGFTGVTLTAVLAAWRHGAPLPRRPVVLTFDDGYASDASRAAPVLARLGWPGVLNLAIRNTGPGGLRLRALRRLVRDRWEIDSHTVNHPDLTMLTAPEVRAELLRSRAWIRRRLGVPASFFCYPAGRFDAAVVRAVRAAGYRGATTELPGVATARDDPFLLPRIRVTAATTPRSLASGA